MKYNIEDLYEEAGTVDPDHVKYPKQDE